MNLIYSACAIIGILASLWLARRLERQMPFAAIVQAPEKKRAIRFAAVFGAVLGSYAFQLPADWFGWSASDTAGHFVGGRTVIGGVALGWLAVECAKAILGSKESTALQFTAPLALAFAFGRIGCALAGCCQGLVVEASSPLSSLLSMAAFDHAPRWPVPWMEATGDLLLAFGFSRKHVYTRLGRSMFPLFLVLWSVQRFVLEFFRENQPLAWGLTYYQFLALGLAAVAAWFAWRWRDAPRLNSSAIARHE